MGQAHLRFSSCLTGLPRLQVIYRDPHFHRVMGWIQSSLPD
jgi:hypothetical protein